MERPGDFRRLSKCAGDYGESGRRMNQETDLARMWPDLCGNVWLLSSMGSKASVKYSVSIGSQLGCKKSEIGVIHVPC